MKKVFFLLFFLPFGLFAQSLDIELKNYPVEIGPHRFSIEGVMDGRKDTSKLGWCLLDKENQGKTYRLKGGLESQLTRYFNRNLVRDTGQTPLYLNVVSLIVVEKANLMREAHAYTQVEFFKKQGDLYGKVYETSFKTESVSEFGKDLYTTHERRIRFLFTQCLRNLSLSKWSEVKPDFISLAELKSDSWAKDTLSKRIQDSVAIFKSKKQQEREALKLSEMTYKSGVLPSYSMEGNTYRTLWPLKKHFAKLGDKGVSRSFVDYKAKIKLSLFTFALGAVLTGFSFVGDNTDGGTPNLALFVPGAVFLGFSVPIYLKSRKVGKATVDKYNVALQNK